MFAAFSALNWMVCSQAVPNTVPSKPYLTFCEKNPQNEFCKNATTKGTTKAPHHCILIECLYTLPINATHICAKSGTNYRTFVSTCELHNFNCENNESKFLRLLFYF